MFQQIKELDRPWYRRYGRYGKRIIGLGSGAGIGAGIRWMVENVDPNWFGFCLAVSIGYLMLDDVYDGGSVGSFSAIGLLIVALLQLPESKPKRRTSIGYTSQRIGDGTDTHQ